MSLAQVRNMEAIKPLSPRSVNIKGSNPHRDPQKYQQGSKSKEQLPDQNLKSDKQDPKAKQKEKDYAPPPPEWIIQPCVANTTTVEKYRTGRLLGRGGFALAYEAELRRTGPGRGNGVVFALKVVKSKMAMKKMEEKFRTELQIHAKMRHPNIVEFHRAFSFHESTFVVLELCSNGSVMDMVKKRRCLSLPEVRRFMVQLCGAIKYMHDRNVIHRDLKMGNLFLDHNMDLKIGDFGLAAVLVSKDEYDGIFNYAKSRRTTLCGTPNYIAPEILEKGKKGHDHKVDIWAIGVILFAMISGRPPFQSSSQSEIYRRARNVDYEWPSEADNANEIPPEAKDLVAQLLKVDADERPDPDHVVSHPFFDMHAGNALPVRMEDHCKVRLPDFIDQHARPRGDVMLKDSPKMSIQTLRKMCGVGRDRKTSVPWPAVGEDTNVSLYRVCANEEAAGTSPVIPLPSDMVYTSKYSFIGTVKTGQDSSAVAPSVNGTRRINIVPERAPNVEEIVAQRRQAKPLRSHAASLRAAEAPLRSRERSRSKAQSGQYIPADQLTSPDQIRSKAGQKLLTELPMRPLRGQALESASRAANLIDTRPALRKSSTDESQEANMIRANRLMTKEHVIDVLSPEPIKTRQVLAARTRARIASNVQDEMKIDAPRPVEQSAAQTFARSSAVPKKKTAATDPLPGSLITPCNVTESLAGTRHEEIMSKLDKLHADLTTCLDETDYQSQKANQDEIDKNSKAFASRPLIKAWVDYSNKYGIGYILSDGTIGCLLNGDATNPVHSIVVHGSERHVHQCLRKNVQGGSSYPDRDQLVSPTGAAVEYICHSGDAESQKISYEPTAFLLKLRKISTNKMERPEFVSDNNTDLSMAVKQAKLRLWNKFAQYMMSTLVAQTDENTGRPLDSSSRDQKTSTETRSSRSKLARSRSMQSAYFVSFYQSVGNVGIYGFTTTETSNRSAYAVLTPMFQFNFPDHSKLVLFATHPPSPSSSRRKNTKNGENGSSLWLDFYYPVSTLSSKGSKDVGKGSETTTRSLLSYPLATLLSGQFMDHDFGEIVHVFELRDKIAFVKDVIASWIKHGGLGKMGIDHGKRMMYKDHPPHGKRWCWLSVGAHGGDADGHFVMKK